jgi:2-polyprenyl-3-methyl-5-hydroxy-6-metoxy-1,4-benzoquinol methylase
MTAIDKSYNATIQRLAPWYQTINLSDDLQIKGHGGCGDPAWPFIREYLPDMEGMRILDVGSNAGIHAIRACQAGAREVVCIDALGQYEEQFDFVYKHFCEKDGVKHPITYKKMLAEDLWKYEDKLGYFDVVFAISILYHLGKITRKRKAYATVQDRIATARLETTRAISNMTDHVIARVRKPQYAEMFIDYFKQGGLKLTDRHERSRIFLEFKR